MDVRPHRREFQKLARLRAKEATVLLNAGLDDGAYYVAGYAVECALKACIARNIKGQTWPPMRTNSYYSHDLSEL